MCVDVCCDGGLLLSCNHNDIVCIWQRLVDNIECTDWLFFFLVYIFSLIFSLDDDDYWFQYYPFPEVSAD